MGAGGVQLCVKYTELLIVIMLLWHDWSPIRASIHDEIHKRKSAILKILDGVFVYFTRWYL